MNKLKKMVKALLALGSVMSLLLTAACKETKDQLGKCSSEGKAQWAQTFQAFKEKYNASPITDQTVAEMTEEWQTKVAACSPRQKALDQSLKVGCTALLSTGKAGKWASHCLAANGPLAPKTNGPCRNPALRRHLEQASLDPSKPNLTAFKTVTDSVWTCLDTAGLSSKLDELGDPGAHPTKGPLGIGVELLAITEGLGDDIQWPSQQEIELAAAGASDRQMAVARMGSTK